MAETDLTPEEAASDARLPQYNTGAYDPVTNEFGFDEDGHQVNQMRQAKDVGVMGRLARRMAMLAGSFVGATDANAKLTAQDAENTRLDRIATAQNVTAASGEVTKAGAQADRSKTEADRAAGFAAGVNLPSITSADALKFLRAKGDRSGYELTEIDLYSVSLMLRRARNANVQITKADKGALIDITAGTFTQTFVSPADLGAGWFCYVRQGGTGDVTIPESDDRTNWIMYPSEVRLFQCNGVALRSIVLVPFYKVFEGTANFIKPPGYSSFAGILRSGGASGTISDAAGGIPGGGGGGAFPFSLPASKLLETEPVTIGAGGAPAVYPGQNSSSTTTVNGQQGGASLFAGMSVLGGAAGRGGAFNGLAASASVRPVGFEGAVGSGTQGLRDALFGGGAPDTNVSPSGPAGASVYGGAAGSSIRANQGQNTPGRSTFGGNGGAAAQNSNGSPGHAPSGGGGATFTGGTAGMQSGPGARGQLDIWGDL